MAIQRNALVSERAIKRRRKKQIMFGAVLAVLVSLLVAGVVWGAYTESFQIKTVTIAGTSGELEESIRIDVQEMLEKRVVWIFPKSNTFLFSKRTLQESILSQYPKVLSAEVKKDGFKALSIDVVEREPDALWCSGVAAHVAPEAMGRCFFVDKTGYIYTQSPYFSDHVYFELYGEPSEYARAIEKRTAASSSNVDVEDGELPTGEITFVGLQYLPEESYQAVMYTIELLKTVDIHTHTLVVHSKDHFELVMDEGGLIKFNLATEPQQIVSDLKTAMDAKFEEQKDKTAEDIEYVDVRFTNKVVFKFVE